MSTSNHDQTLRSQLVTAMRGTESQIDFASAVKDFPAKARGAKPAGAPHSAWQLLEHMRIAQHDILEFSRDANHQSPPWPQGYWPKEEAPPDEHAWEASIASFERDAKALGKLMEDTHNDLFKAIPHGQGQTLLREAMLVATHNSYHLGQLVFLKKSVL